MPFTHRLGLREVSADIVAGAAIRVENTRQVADAVAQILADEE
jgi:hypothetical protein